MCEDMTDPKVLIGARAIAEVHGKNYDELPKVGGFGENVVDKISCYTSSQAVIVALANNSTPAWFLKLKGIIK